LRLARATPFRERVSARIGALGLQRAPAPGNQTAGRPKVSGSTSSIGTWALGQLASAWATAEFTRQRAPGMRSGGGVIKAGRYAAVLDSSRIIARPRDTSFPAGFLPEFSPTRRRLRAEDEACSSAVTESRYNSRPWSVSGAFPGHATWTVRNCNHHRRRRDGGGVPRARYQAEAGCGSESTARGVRSRRRAHGALSTRS
jgi:hypothetical protein